MGVGIVRYLLGSKLGRELKGQTLEELREEERLAARDYWRAWKFGVRTSLVTGTNRGADRPVNAVLNYLYALAEAECVIACHAVGLDPGLGILHTDKPRRQSMALDLLEPVRPAVEEYVLGVKWRPRDFLELADGTCRVRAPLTHELAETLPLWAAEVAPHAERVAHMLGEALRGRFTPTTPLTGRFTRQREARRARERPGTAEGDVYRAEVVPLLAGVSTRAIMEAIGCSKASAQRYRKGERVPKASAWAALRRLGA